MLNYTPGIKNLNQSKTAIIVLAMHRSGSSLLTRMINLMGIPLGVSLIAPNKDNPKGFFEHKDIIRYHEDLLNNFGMTWSYPLNLPANWTKSSEAQFCKNLILEVLKKEFSNETIFAIKDPRMCKLLPMWQDLLPEFNTTAKYITIIRHPLEVAQSLYVREKLNYEISYLLWLKSVLEPLPYIKDSSCAYITFAEIIQNYQMAIAKIGSNLDLHHLSSFSHNNYAVKLEIDESLYHNKSSNIAKLSGSSLENQVINIYDFIQNNINDYDTLIANLTNAYNWLNNMTQLVNPVLLYLYNEINTRDETILSHQEELLKSYRQIDKRDKALNDLYNSASWKLTEPIRKLNKKLIKKFQDHFNE